MAAVVTVGRNVDLLSQTAFTGQQMFSAVTLRGHIEICQPFVPRPQISHVVFDFDGTLSWLRHRWPEIMCELFLEYLQPKPGEPACQLHDKLLVEILALNGKPSLFQMRRCVEMGAQRGETVPPAETLLTKYQERLTEALEQRTAEIIEGRGTTDAFLVYGARAFLERLRERGLTLIILSGTAEEHVIREADLLGLRSYFGPHIYGSTPDLALSSKDAILTGLLRDEKVSGEQVLCFGDGPVELALCRAAGGLAIGVASDEMENGSGRNDPHKRQVLVGAGAHAIIPDYREPQALIECLLGE